MAVPLCGWESGLIWPTLVLQLSIRAGVSHCPTRAQVQFTVTVKDGPNAPYARTHKGLLTTHKSSTYVPVKQFVLLEDIEIVFGKGTAAGIRTFLGEPAVTALSLGPVTFSPPIRCVLLLQASLSLIATAFNLITLEKRKSYGHYSLACIYLMHC